MSQPNPTVFREPDPLLAFFEEAGTPKPVASPEPVQRVEVQENAADPAVVPASEGDPDWRRRLERVERQIDRTLIDISTLKSDLATLVSAVEDMKKRTNRPSVPPSVAVLPVQKVRGPRAIAAIVILLMAGALAWGLAPAGSSGLPDPPPAENETSSAVEARPIVEPPVPQAPVVMPASAAGGEERNSSIPSPAPARAAPPRARPAAASSYVGTLIVDADPAADVYLNRKKVGRTPVRLENLRAGSHLIWIERDGYRRWTRVVAVTADRISRVSASLDPLAR